MHSVNCIQALLLNIGQTAASYNYEAAEPSTVHKDGRNTAAIGT